MTSVRSVATFGALSFLLGCGGVDGTAFTAGGGGAGGGTGVGTGTGGAGSTGAATGLPCDIRALLAANCTSCHSNPPVGGAPVALVTYADLTAASTSNPAKTEAALSLERMKSTTAPMPPGGSVSGAELAAFSAWLSAGTPQGTCGTGTGTDTFAGASVCTSKVMYTGTVTSSSMAPGRACMSCHDGSGDAPMFDIAGTVYPTGHEPDNCDGTNTVGGAAAATVVVTDAQNTAKTLPVNSVGNFYLMNNGTPLARPYKAKVVFNGKERAMGGSQTSGDCNSCHTDSGASGAPGRIALP